MKECLNCGKQGTTNYINRYIKNCGQLLEGASSPPKRNLCQYCGMIGDSWKIRQHEINCVERPENRQRPQQQNELCETTSNVQPRTLFSESDSEFGNTCDFEEEVGENIEFPQRNEFTPSQEVALFLEELAADNVPENTIKKIAERIGDFKEKGILSETSASDSRYFSQKKRRIKVVEQVSGVELPLCRDPVSSCYVAKIEELIGMYLSFEDVFEYVTKARARNDDVYSSVLDGDVYSRKIEKRQGFLHLPIIIFVDDARYRRNRNKTFTYIYLTVASVPYWVRCQEQHLILLQAIPLEKTNNIGLKACISNIIHQLNGLTQAKNMWIPGLKKSIPIQVCVIAIIGDNKGLHELLGLTVAFHIANYLCRGCLQHSGNFDEFRQEWPKRSEESDEGLVRENCLEELDNFSCVQQTPFDLAHIDLEGEIEREIKFFFEELPLSSKNVRNNFKKVKQTTDFKNVLPSVIPEDYFDAEKNGFALKADEMFYFVHVIFALAAPALKGEFAQSPCVESMRLRLKTLENYTSNALSEEEVDIAEKMQETQHRLFVETYSTVVPKTHYRNHFPQQIRNFGPLRETWTMAGERQHSNQNERGRNSNLSDDTLYLLERAQRKQLVGLLKSGKCCRKEFEEKEKAIVIRGVNIRKGTFVQFLGNLYKVISIFPLKGKKLIYEVCPITGYRKILGYNFEEENIEKTLLDATFLSLWIHFPFENTERKYLIMKKSL